ncbi:MAG: hypothetical protein KAH77_05340, partial [Thiomargarita sp.]|nr:hypothetical protein [Thiomargarita sp.]
MKISGSLVLLLLSSQFVYAELLPKAGSCFGFDFPLQRDKIHTNTSWPLRVLRHKAPVYKHNKIVDTLKFGDILDVIQVSNDKKYGRIQVKTSDSDDPIGWMDRQDLLCHITPLTDQNGLERKAYIRTPRTKVERDKITGKQTIKGVKETVQAYHHYARELCSGSGSCVEMSRFEMYFIMAETNVENQQQRYLLAEQQNLITTPPLVGWVDKDKIIPWNTAIQLRPREDLTEPVAAFSKPGVQNKKEGITLEGGNIWYKLSQHLPLLDKTNGYYHVVAPGIGVSAMEEVNVEGVESFKQIDVFFVLDGTRSMQAYLSAAKDLANKIIEKLSRQNEYRESHFRFGFRVYRDDFKGSRFPKDDSLGEFLALSNSCEARDATTQENKMTFKLTLSKVKESNEKANEDPSLEENMFKGLEQAVRDMAPCPKRLKLLFIIGDHGDNQADVPKHLIKKLTSTFDLPPALFFIQTPKNHQKYKQPQYKKAYTRFQQQAQSIIQQVNHSLQNKDSTVKQDSLNWKAHFRTMSGKHITQELVDLVVNFVGKFSRSDIINEMLLKLRAGQSVKDIVKQGMAADDSNLPVVYWQMLEKAACQTIGDEQCYHGVDHRVIDAYIPVSDKIVEEIWISGRQLKNWSIVLNSLLPKHNKQEGFQQQKTSFIAALKQELVN